MPFMRLTMSKTSQYYVNRGKMKKVIQKKMGVQKLGNIGATMEKSFEKYKKTDIYYEDPEKLIQNEKDKWDYVTEEEYQELRDSAKQFGILHPVYATHDYKILAGKNRVAIAQELGLKVPCIRFKEEIPHDIEVKVINHTNLGRKITSDMQRKIVYKQFGDLIGKHGALKHISEVTGINYNRIKQWNVKYTNEKKFKAEPDLSEKEIKEGNRLYILHQKAYTEMNKHNTIMKKLRYDLEKIAPLSFWHKKFMKKKLGT